MATVALISRLRFELHPLWPRLDDAARRKAALWGEIVRRMASTSDANAEIERIRRDFGGSLGHLSRSSIYRRWKNVSAYGLEGALNLPALRKAKNARTATGLPPGFVAFWRGLCGLHQRGKTLAAWRGLMRDHLAAGRMIPGYGTDWRGIWLRENGGRVAPSVCPYTAIHQGAGAYAPRGWSYSSLCRLAPEADALAGATRGVQAMHAASPSVPKTRVGLGAMEVITMDDVMLDAYCWYGAETEPRRPVGLGVMDVATGCMVDFTMIPVRRRDDGTLAKIDGSHARYIWAHVLCGIGIDATHGVTALLEHGTAGLSADEERRINALLGTCGDGRPWLRVLRSSTSGAPILKGLFAERGRGRPTHKAMLESAWNLLHNELASLPAPAGRNWESAPMDTTGWTREDKALVRTAAALLAERCPEAVEAIARARTHALTYAELLAAVQKAIAAMNDRRDHRLEGWKDAGNVRHAVEIGGVTVDLESAADSLGGGNAKLKGEFLAQLAPRAKAIPMSPAEAWGARAVGLKRFSAFIGTRILGPELAQRVTVDSRHQFTARNDYTGEKILFAATFRDENGETHVRRPGETFDVWVNPLRFDWAVACETNGRFVGAAPMMARTAYGEDAKENLGILQLVRSEQKRRVAAAAAAGRLAREEERRLANARALRDAERATVDEGTRREIRRAYNLPNVLRALAGDKSVDIGFEREVSDEILARTGRKDAQGIIVPDFIRAAANTSDGSLTLGTPAYGADTGAGGVAGVGGTGKDTIATNLLAGSFIEAVRDALVLTGAGMQTLSGLTGDIAIPKGGKVNAAWVTNENGDASKTNPTFGQVTATPHTVGAYTDITRKLLLQSSIDVQGFVVRELVYAIAYALENAGFSGTGANGQPTGLVSQVAQSVSFTPGAPTLAKVLEMVTKIDEANGNLGPQCFVGRPGVWGLLGGTIDWTAVSSTGEGANVVSGVTSGKYLLDTATNTVQGYRFVKSNIAPAKTLLFGDFSQLMLCLWSGTDLTVDQYSQCTKGALRVVALQDADFIVRQPAAFAKGTTLLA